jgi:hypothetical protein
VSHLTTTPCFRVVRTFDLPPLQGASLGGRFPGLKPWAESSSPFGAKTFRRDFLLMSQLHSPLGA